MEINIRLNLEEVNQLLDILINQKEEKRINWRLLLKVDRAYGRITRKLEKVAG